MTRGRTDLGLLVIRVGLGAMFVAHGLPKLAGGPAKWAKLGGAMKALGIDAFPTAWGLAAACSETFGGLLLALGVAFVPACLALLATMAVAVTMHVRSGDGFGGWSHAAEAAVVFAGLALAGPGRHVLRLRRGTNA